MSLLNQIATDSHSDLIIFGSGSTAFAAVIRAAELGKRVIMTEARTVGETCVNRGCPPSINLIAAAEILHTMRHPRYPGIQLVEPMLDFPALIRLKDAVIDS